MIEFLKELFTVPKTNSIKTSYANEHKLEIAACALLLEIAKADDDFSKEEKNRILEIMKNKFHLNGEDVKNILAESEQSIEKSISLYEFTDILNRHLNTNEKYAIIKYLWHIAYADGNLDTYEDHYIKTISNNLHLYNKDRIAAKMEVKQELGL